MSRCHEAPDWRQYTMDYYRPHRELEPVAKEVAVVASALRVLHECEILPNTEYDHDKMLAHRQRVRDAFEIPWTAISPRVQRLLYRVQTFGFYLAALDVRQDSLVHRRAVGTLLGLEAFPSLPRSVGDIF